MSVLAELLDIEMPPWWMAAACRGHDPDVFFPVGDGPKLRRPGAYDAAIAICARCPVRQACLDRHLDEQLGVWGGTSPQERYRLRCERDGRAPRKRKRAS